jgi:predicted porin
MKKSLLALAVLGGFASVASAQSSVTLFGIVDLAGTYVKNDGSDRRLSLTQDGYNSSRLGFRGVEDLGGGMKAGFWLEAGLGADTGAMGTGLGTTGQKTFNRRSTVSLMGNWGEVRLGRDYTPTFWNQTIFDVFGTNGVGSSLNVAQIYAGTRQDNTIQYFLPSNIGGFYGQAMMGAAEGGTSADKPERYLGLRLGYAAGPFDVAVAAATQRIAGGLTFANNGATIASGESQKTYNIGGSWDFGMFKLMGYWDRESAPSLTENRYNIGGALPLGPGNVRLAYERSKFTNDQASYSNTVSQYSLGYVYDLSKRTALYATVSRLSNGDRSKNAVASGSAITAAPTAGGKSTGAQLGIRHSF